ncbi:MAG: polysaccharide biosynthesis protein [Agathobacter sp.]|nr:polysaccharide biosynthesis protein [Agathobacter sp.]
MGSSKKDSNFLVQGSILAAASIISRIIGLLYRLPMTDIIGDTGNNYYSCAFEIYNIMLIISSYSLPLAVSKLVSARIAKGQRRQAYQVFKGALLFAVIAGTAVALVVYFGAEMFTAMLQTPLSIFALKILAPVLVVVAVLGVLRGFFQGLGNMLPSAISQIIEQIVNAIISIWAAYVLFQYGTKIGQVLGDPERYAAAMGAAGGTLGTNLGAVSALLFMLFVFYAYMRVFKKKMKRERNVEVESFGYIMKILVITIIPVLLSSTIYNISGILDQGIFKNIATAQGAKPEDIDVWWGVFSGKYKVLINVPISIASAMAASSVPSLSASYAAGDKTAVNNQINAAIRFIMVIAIPCAVGLAVLAKPIFTLLFPGTIATVDLATQMMWVGAVAVVFYSLSTLTNGLLQGIDKLKIPVKNAAIALVAHLLLLVALMMIFRLHIYAVVIANAFFAFLVCVLNSIALARHAGYKQEIIKTFVIPAIASGAMGIIAYGAYALFYYLTKNNLISILIAIILAVVTYAVILLLLKGLGEDELRRFPKGHLLIAIAKKFRLLK